MWYSLSHGPYHLEVFPTGFVIGCDKGGFNCIRNTSWNPGQIGVTIDNISYLFEGLVELSKSRNGT